VLTGLDGAAWFSWSKRGWAWREGKERVLSEADQFPYSNLIPFARRADAIRGVLEFAGEMESVREFVLPKPWGPEPGVALLYSWDNARRRNWEPGTRDRTGKYHAAMRYLHWNMEALPSHMATAERLARYDFVVAGGIDHVEPELIEALQAYAAGGGTLLVGDGLMDRDVYGRPLSSSALLGVRPTAVPPTHPDPFRVVGLPDDDLLPGDIVHTAGVRGVALAPGAQVVLADSGGQPVLTRSSNGGGDVYFLAADLRGYPLAKILNFVRAASGSSPSLSIRDAGTGQLAPNVLVSRRSYAAHHALLMQNADPFSKTILIRLRALSGRWYVAAPLEGRAFDGPGGRRDWSGADIANVGVRTEIDASGFALLLISRDPWTKSQLRRVPTP
jgi:hypothetical protein